MKKTREVILIGGSHHNILGLVRSFGINGIRPYGIIVCEQGYNSSFVAYSRYWEKTWIVHAESEAVDLMKKLFLGQDRKPVVIPCSDSIAMELDIRFNELKKYFLLPSIGNEEGVIANLMDKNIQADFCKKHGLLMAQSWVVNLEKFEIPSKASYPVIFKPVTSAEGKKLDIKKCDNKKEAELYVKKLFDKGYRRFLMQEYITFDKELEFIGSIGDEDAYIISENIREWPIIGGTNSFFKIINDIGIKNDCLKILAVLKSIGFVGCFDIELFRYHGKTYVNEINWRNTGNSFFSLGSNVHYGVIWYLTQCGCNTNEMMHINCDMNQYAMNEATDLRHVVFGKLPIKAWIADFRKTKSFSLWYSSDLMPVIIRYIYLFRELVRRY